jgi:uncharacterized protein (UPF0548 family)
MFLISQPSANRVSKFISSQQHLPFSYREVGATRDAPGSLPAHYNHDHHRVCLGSGKEVFARAVTALRAWRQFELGWVAIVPERALLAEGETVAVRAHTFGVWSLSAARVVYLLQESGAVNRFAFAYGTLPGHVERGEERFMIEWRQADDSVWYDIVAFSRPQHPLVKLSFLVARRLQRRFARESMARMKTLVQE